MKYLLVGLYRIIVFPIVFIGALIELVFIMGGAEFDKKYPWIWKKLYGEQPFTK